MPTGEIQGSRRENRELSEGTMVSPRQMETGSTTLLESLRRARTVYSQSREGRPSKGRDDA